MLKRATLLSFFAVLLSSQWASAETKKVLFIGKQPDHPFGTHMYLHTCGMLAKCLANHGVETVISDGWPQDAETLADIDAMVVYTTPAAELLLDGIGRTCCAASVSLL